MKKVRLFFLPLLMLSACSSGGGANNSITELDIVYSDYSTVITDNYDFRIGDFQAGNYNKEDYDFSIWLVISNKTEETKKIEFDNMSLKREDTNEIFGLREGYIPFRNIGAGEESSFCLVGTIPTSLDIHYTFSVKFKNLVYSVHLYETPDELRPDLTVSFAVNGTVVNSRTVKKGRTLVTPYVYDSLDHQTNAGVWKDPNGESYSEKTKVEQNVTLTGELSNNFAFLTTSSDAYTFITGINHVHADGKVVVLGEYEGKEVCLGNYAIYRNSKIKEIYLPVTLHGIYSSNFSECGNLKTIYFAGTQEQWEAIPKSFVTIPSSINIVYNTSFYC